ncbi:MoxR-like ATPase [Clostridiaceae bacterium JG1575]|nr:MoxR-like ATPase [Clostridiaceae bacterium JG1575]
MKEKCKDLLQQALDSVSAVMVGRDEEIRLILTACLAGGHVLLEDLPGQGKTMMVKAFAKTLGLPFKRIQFTPDLLPSDLTGIQFYNQKDGDFIFREGPLFANVVLADEVNRATPRTQSALLEAMEEQQVTSDGITRPLPLPFMVLATQNPIETYGTFPLPEAQMDRFALRLSMGYPSVDEEMQILLRNEGNILKEARCVMTGEELMEILDSVRSVTIREEVLRYLVEVTQSTRKDPRIRTGVSPRGAVVLHRLAKAYAALSGRSYIIPEDIRTLAPHAFNHRIFVRDNETVDGLSLLVRDVISTVPVPVESL